jgi:hypothetical protein
MITDDDHLGCFFMEWVNYLGPILDWINGGGPPNPARHSYLGITFLDPLNTIAMWETKLSQIPLRLGIQYYHVCHGDLEMAVLLCTATISHLEVVAHTFNLRYA